MKNFYYHSSHFGNYLYICIVRVIAKSTLRKFWEKHKDSEQQLQSWYREAEEANWSRPQEIKRDFPSAGIIAGNRVVFNIKGNRYRLVIRINYDYGLVWIRFVGTHEQYNYADTKTI